MEEEMILNKKSNKKKVILLGMLLLIVIAGTVGVAYATYRFQTEGDSSTLVTGDIYMHYKGKNVGISIEDAVPSETYDSKEYFEFTIEGKNTYTEKDIWYEIDLVEGDEPEGRKTRIDDKYLRFTLTEKIESGQERTVVNSVGYDDITNKKIWVNKIDKNTNEEIKITYKLYMWISDEVHIGYDDENEIQFDYTPDEWANNIYASVKVNVKGDFIEKEIDEAQYNWLPRNLPTNLLERIKKLAYYRDGEIIAINKTGGKCEGLEKCTDNIREYRYSGPEVNNYIYLKDNNNRDELWRIIGIFEDDEAGEYIKIVRNSILPESYLPTTFKASNGSTYKIQNSEIDDKDYAYGNNLTGTNSDNNNWPTAGLQYYLNAEQETDGNTNGYLHYLSSAVKDQLVSVKHYLGTYHAINVPFDTPKEAYAHERDVENCVEGKGPISNNSTKAVESESSGCHVWAGNDATWNDGKVSLMYPSDYGFSASENNWETPLFYGEKGMGFEDTVINATTWMYQTMSDAKNKRSWMLSPASYYPYFTAYWQNSGSGSRYPFYNYACGVRPVLNLSSSTTWLDGDGTKNNPYKIIAD